MIKAVSAPLAPFASNSSIPVTNGKPSPPPDILIDLINLSTPTINP